MFRKIARIGHLLTFEYYAWHSTYNTMCVPVSLVTLRMGSRSVLVSTPEYGWRSDYDTDLEATKVFHKFLSCIHTPSPTPDFDAISVDSARYSAARPSSPFS